MKRIHYAWVICFCATIILFCNLGINVNLISVYLPLIQNSGVSASVCSSLISVRSFSGLISMLLIPVFYRWFSYRTGLTVTLLFSALSSVIYAVAQTTLTYYAAAFFGGIGYGFGTLVPASVIINAWFCEKRGTALGICSMGSGFALILLPSVILKLTNQVGLRNTFLIQAAFFAFNALLIFLLVRDTPESAGCTAYGADVPHAEEEATTCEALPDRTDVDRVSFVLLMIAMIAIGGIANGGPGHFSILLITSGYSAGTASLFLSIFGIAMAGSKLLLGVLADRIGTKKASILATIICILGCFISVLLDGSSLFSCILFTVLFGLGFGITSVGVSLWAEDFSSREHYSATVKNFQSMVAAGGILLASIPGMIYEHTGEYQSSYALYGVLISATCVIILTVYRNQKKQQTLSE